MWKTRLRCALNKSTDFQEVPDRNQLDITEPYKVYRIQQDSSSARPIGTKKQDHTSHWLYGAMLYLQLLAFFFSLNFSNLVSWASFWVDSFWFVFTLFFFHLFPLFTEGPHTKYQVINQPKQSPGSPNYLHEQVRETFFTGLCDCFSVAYTYKVLQQGELS